MMARGGRTYILCHGMDRAKLVLLCILAAVACLFLARPDVMQTVRSDITGKEYSVRRAPDSQHVADRLAMLEVRLGTLLDHAARTMPQDPRIAAIRSKWDGTLSEVQTTEDVAFSVDKSSIHVCVRHRNGHIEDLNATMFVLIHELAHVATRDYGHSPEFWANMRFLLELAERAGVYRYENHESATFCGHPLGASPLTCVKNRTCTSTLAA